MDKDTASDLRHKLICPIRDSKKFAAQHPYCPWFHPQFIKGSGCYKNIRIFSRLLSLLMQKPTVKGLSAMPIFVPSLILPF